MWTLSKDPMIGPLLPVLTSPLKCRHPYNLDTSLAPKGVHIIGVPLYIHIIYKWYWREWGGATSLRELHPPTNWWYNKFTPPSNYGTHSTAIGSMRNNIYHVSVTMDSMIIGTSINNVCTR